MIIFTQSLNLKWFLLMLVSFWGIFAQAQIIQRTYKFEVPASSILNVGDIVGRLVVTRGEDGVYYLNELSLVENGIEQITDLQEVNFRIHSIKGSPDSFRFVVDGKLAFWIEIDPTHMPEGASVLDLLKEPVVYDSKIKIVRAKGQNNLTMAFSGLFQLAASKLFQMDQVVAVGQELKSDGSGFTRRIRTGGLRLSGGKFEVTVTSLVEGGKTIKVESIKVRDPKTGHINNNLSQLASFSESVYGLDIHLQNGDSIFCTHKEL